MKRDMDGSTYLTLEDVRKQWRVNNQTYDMLRAEEERGSLSPKNAQRLAALEKKAVESYVRIVNRWADRMKKEVRR